MSQNKSIQSLKPHIRYNKNFIYKGKKYPIDFNLVINNSNYFYERQDQFMNIDDILLTEKLIDISEESITCFVASCHFESFEINESNVFSLHQLSIKYEVTDLISLTDEFIKKYDTTLIFRSIQYKYQLQKQNSSEAANSNSLEKDEEYVASNLFKYINNEQLLNLPITILYRIINNPKLDINKLNETNKNQMIDFLFKCLNKYGKKASVLFLNLDVENQRIDIFSKLINEYHDIFDFNMINQKFLMKTTTDLLSELVQAKHNYSNSISQINQLLSQIKDEKQKQQELFDSFKQFGQEQLKKETDKLNVSFQNLNNQIEKENKNSINEFDKKINNMNLLVDQNIQKIQSDFKLQVDALTETVRKLTEKVAQQDGLIEQLKQKHDEEKKPKPSLTKYFVSESDPGGIISFLGDSVTVTCSSSDDQGLSISNIKKNDNSKFINKNYKKPQSESETYIIFDFRSKIVDLCSYFIRGAENYYPKTWRIEGSNDQSQWKLLDRKVNDQSLQNNSKHQNHFYCNEAKNKNDCGYRFIRYVQEDSCFSGDPYRVLLCFFELYGEIYND